MPLNRSATAVATANRLDELTTTTTATYTTTNDNRGSTHSTEFTMTSGLLLWINVNGILFIFILVGNVLTIIAVRTCRNLRSVISNLFILSLAISDVIVGLAIPYQLAFYLGSGLGAIRACCLFRFFLLIFACCVSILTLITIAIDRYIAVMYALHYRRCMTRRVACFIIATNWSLGAFIALLPIFWNNWSNAKECEFDEVLSPWYVAGVITPGFAIIWLCMLMVYWRIMREASKQAHKLRQSVVYSSTAPQPNLQSVLHPDWKSVQIVVFIMGCFTLCWLPYFIVAIAQLYQMCRSTTIIYKAAFSLAMTNSALNPIIYSWKNTNFRKSFAKTLCCKSKICCPSLDNHSKPNESDVPPTNRRLSSIHRTTNNEIALGPLPLVQQTSTYNEVMSCSGILDELKLTNEQKLTPLSTVDEFQLPTASNSSIPTVAMYSSI